MAEAILRLLESLPGRNCGQCGYRTCAELAAKAAEKPELIARCVHLAHPSGQAPVAAERPASWKDIHGQDYDFVLEQFPDDPGPRETIVPLNPANLERLDVKKGDVLFGRPAMVGCPVTHVGVVVEEPDRLNGVIVWCIVGPLAARQGGKEIGHYHILAYEGLASQTRTELVLGRRYFFLPQTCVLQTRHSGLVNAMARRSSGLRVRLEGIWIG